ncbi:hypothetical protein [Nonomuraea fuscirosea]|uniref:hypothetical protein n=1 Tax=Nonomuraea fuscirosea TaxID=1291556 RepID=UPI00340051A5
MGNANKLHGGYDITIVLHPILHPLTEHRDATDFHLKADRLRVLASRHRHACIVVARAEIPELLDSRPSTAGV